MTKFSGNVDRDASYAVVGGGLPFRTNKTVAFTGAAGLGAQGTVSLFTVTGEVVCKLMAKCTEDLAGATATLEVGVSGNTAFLHGQETATNIDNGDVVTSDAGTKVGGGLALNEYFIAGGADIIATVATADITDGTLIYTLLWRPISDDGAVVAA